MAVDRQEALKMTMQYVEEPDVASMVECGGGCGKERPLTDNEQARQLVESICAVDELEAQRAYLWNVQKDRQAELTTLRDRAAKAPTQRAFRTPKPLKSSILIWLSVARR